MVYATEKTLKESGDKAEKATKEEAEKEMNEMKEALKGTDQDKIKNQFEKLQQAVYKMSEQIYKAQGGPTPPEGQPPQGEEKKEPSIDAEYEMKDDK